MIKSNILKKIVASFLLINFAFGNTLMCAYASDITGVTPNGNVYNIEGQKFSGQTQFRQYDNFKLDNGDVANLIYQNGYTNFVNLVDNQVNINGIVNTMQNNNFYNGHAVFVSPAGVVVGASGVLNVGSLSILTPSISKYTDFKNAYGTDDLSAYEVNANSYKGLIQDSQGNIVLNGKIISRGDVNLYGSSIAVQKDTTALTNNTAGIIAGYQGANPTSLSDAEAIFNSLVSNDQINANGIELSNGNINLVANNTISVTHDTLKDHSLYPTTSKSAEVATTSINFDNAVLAAGSDVIASAVSTHTVNLQGGDLETGLNIGTIISDPKSLIGADLNEFFEGARANSKIDVVSSQIYSKNNTNFTSNAVTNFVVTSDTDASKFIYALGTETASNINIKDSLIQADNDFIAQAFSQNQSDLALKNSLMYSDTQSSDDKNLMLFVNQTTKATTSSTSDNSKIKAKNISLISRNYNSDNVNITTTGQTKGKTGVALSALIKNQQIDTTSEVKNSSELTSQKGGVDVTSQNLAIAKNNVTLSIDNNTETSEEGIGSEETDEVLDGLTDQMDTATEDSTSSSDHGENAIDVITEGSSSTPLLTGSANSVQIGGAFLVNRSNINTTADVDNSTISGVANTYILANAVDLTSNITNATTENAQGDFCSGLAVGVNSQKKSTYAEILNGSNIYSDGLFVNATTELPMNQDALKFAIKMSGLDSEITMDTDVSSSKLNTSGSDIFSDDTATATGTNATNVKLAGSEDKSISYTNFFHNIAKSSTANASDTVGITGSFVYNSIKNDTKATIDSSTVNVTNGSVVLNAINSVTNYNAVGAPDFIFSYITKDGETEKIADYSAGGNYAIGGAVLVNYVKNNADAIISNNSTVIATASDVNVDSSNEASYISAAAMGAGSASGSASLALEGSVVIQTIEGETNSQITSSSNVSGNNVNVIAGEAVFNPVNRDDGLPNLNSEGLINFSSDSRTAEDKVFDIVLSGAMMSTSNSDSSGVAVGASVNVNNINRTLSALIDNSVVSALQSVSVNSDTFIQAINVAIAGDFKGGVSTDKTYQTNANAGSTTEKTNGAQQFGNYGGWIDDLDNIVDDSNTKSTDTNPTLTSETHNYASTTQAATSTTIYNALNDETTQDALTSSTSKVAAQTVPVEDYNGNYVKDPLNDDANLEQQKAVQYHPVYDSSTNKWVYEDDANPPNRLQANGKDVEVSNGGSSSTSATDLSTELATLAQSKSTNSNLLTSGSNDVDSLTGDTANTESGKADFSNAVAGSVNVYTNKSNVQSAVTNSTITAGTALNVTSNHQSELINNANCETNASKVGTGGAVNVGNFKEKVASLLSNSTVDKSGSSNYDVNITANGYNKVTDEATSKGESGSAIGGSFNVSVDSTNVSAKLTNSSNIYNANDVVISSDNYIDLYKKSGLTQKDNTGGAVGIGIAGAINILKNISEAGIDGADNINSNNLSVKANSKKDSSGNVVYNTIKSVAIAGDIVKGSKESGNNYFELPGAFATDIIENSVSAYIKGTDTINATGDIAVDAAYNINILNLDGALTFDSSATACGVGLGAIVEVFDSNITSSIEDTNILSSNSVDTSSTFYKNLELLVANLGVNVKTTVSVNVNGVVNVVQDHINSYIKNSNITTSKNLNLAATHNINENALAILGDGAKSWAIGGDAVVNILHAKSEVKADEDSSISAGGDITVSNYINEHLDVNTAGVTASDSVTALAATVDVNLIENETSAIFSADVLNSKSLTVSATDLTTETAERNTLVAATGGGFGLANVLTLDIVEKTIQAEISDAGNISSSGAVSVNAKSDNAFGAHINPDTGTYEENEIGSISAIVDDGKGQLSTSSDFKYWQFAINGAGSGCVGINETVVAKSINNQISATIENSTINSDGVNVSVNDYSINNALLGDVAGAKCVSFGGSEYINILTSTNTAQILSGTTINSTGDVSVTANNKEVLRDILVVAGGAELVTINGGATINVIDNTTNAIIDQGVNITQAKNLSVTASNIEDAESADVSAGGAEAAQIGGMFTFNQFKADTNARIGIEDITQPATTTIINASGDIAISASDEEDYSAMMYTAGGAATAAVDGSVVINILESNTNALVNISDITTSAGKIDVDASHYFNPGVDVSADMLKWMQDNATSVQDPKGYISSFNAAKFNPLVSTLNLEGAGAATVTGNVTSNNFDSNVKAEVYKSTISSLNGMNVDAEQTLTTFDAMAGAQGAGIVDIITNGVVNIINDETFALVDETTVTSGGAFASASEGMNINSAQFGLGGAGTVAIQTAVGVAVIDNYTKSAITNSNITGGAKADSSSSSFINNFFVVAGGSGDASIMLSPAVNYYIGNTTGYIDNTTITGGENSASGIVNYITNNLLASGSLSVVGASVNALAVVNDLMFDTSGYITNSVITDAVSTQALAQASNNIYSFASSLAITVAEGGSIPATGIVCDYHNNQNAYIEDSSIQGGSVLVNATNDITANTFNGTGGVVGLGGAIEAVGLVNYLISETNAYIQNVEASDVTQTTVTAESKENLSANNFSVGGGAGVFNACALVNYLKNSTIAYINTNNSDDSEYSDYKSTGAMKVQSTDDYLLYCYSGIAAVSVADAGANVNVNEINNTVNAYIAKGNGNIEAGSVDVTSDSTIGVTAEANSYALGLGEIAGDVLVAMIGGALDFSSIQTTVPDLYNELYKYAVPYAKSTVTNLGYTVPKSKDNNDGTVASISGNVKAQNDINVEASTTLKGYDNNTYQTSNKINSDVVSITAGVHYNELKYNTEAYIENANVTSENGNVTVQTNKTINANTKINPSNIVSALTFDGGVAYYLSTVNTQSFINNSNVSAAGNLDVTSNSYTNFNTYAASEGVSGIDYYLSIAHSDDDSVVHSKITGDSSGSYDISAKNINVITTTGSDLTTELQSKAVAGLTIDTIFNSVTSNIDAQALIDAENAKINVDNMTIATKNSGINLTNNYYSSSISIINAACDEQGSYAAAIFKSGINTAGDISISGYSDDFAENINIYNNVSPNDTTVAGAVNAEIIENEDEFTGISGAGIEHTVASDLSAITSIQSGTGTIKTNNMNVSSLADRNAQITAKESTVALAVDVEVYTLEADAKGSSPEGSNTITFSGENIIADTLNVVLNDNSNAYSQVKNNSISLLAGADPVNITSIVDVNTDVTLSGKLSAGTININNDVNRYSNASTDFQGGGFVNVTDANLTSEAKGSTTLNITHETPSDYQYANNMTVNHAIKNTVETYCTSESGGFVSVKNADLKNDLDTTTELNIANANINSTGDINIAVTSDNNIIRKEESTSGGVIVISTAANVNTANNTTTLSIQDSTIKANNIKLSATSHFGDPLLGLVIYKAAGGGFLTQDWTSIESDITQNTNITLANVKMEANHVFSADVNSNSDFKSSLQIDADGFIAGAVPQAIIKATNSNTFSMDESSTITAGSAFINMNSSNNLHAEAQGSVEGFSGTCDANANAEVDLTVNNKVDIKGANGTGAKIETSNLAQINFMTESTNDLYQYTYEHIDAAMPFGGVDGSITSAINNQLDIGTQAIITSGQDVVVNFLEGDMTIDSLSEDKITCRMLFGIPIDCSDAPKSDITETLNNTMQFDGYIIAQSDNQRYLEINADGDVAVSFNFLDSAFEKYASVGEITGAEMKEAMLIELNAYLEKLNNLLASLNSQEKKAEDKKKIVTNWYNADSEEYSVISSTYVKNLIGLAENSGDDSVEKRIDNYMQKYLVKNPPSKEAGISSDQYNDMIDYMQSFYDNNGRMPDQNDLTAYMNDNNFTDTQQQNVLQQTKTQMECVSPEYFDLRQARKSDGAYHQYTDMLKPDVYIIMSDDERTTRLNYLTASTDALSNEISNLSEQITNINNTIPLVQNKINETNNLINYISGRTFTDIKCDNAAYVFEDIAISNGQILLNNIPNTSITGNGQFVIPSGGIEVENYSDLSVIFKNVYNMPANDSGYLIINGKDFYNSTHIDSQNEVSCDNEQHTTQGPHLITSYPQASTYNIPKGITIKNYFDNNDPIFGNAKAASDIFLAGAVRLATNLYVWNESGNIQLSNGYIIDNSNANNYAKLYATQGDIFVYNPQLDMVINDDDILYAGRNALFQVNSLENNGSITVGQNSRRLTITDDMLTNLIVDPSTGDPTTGVQNMINIGMDDNNDVSPILNAVKDNIKALYIADENKIQVFGVLQEGGKFSAYNGDSTPITPTGTGSILVTTGYSDIEITNNTSKDIEIFNIKNNYMEQSSANPQLTERTAIDKATTNISSKSSNLETKGYIKNAYKADEYGTGDLSIVAKKILVDDYINGTEQGKAIEAYGNLTMAAQNGIDIAGYVYERGGDTLISNDTANSNLLMMMAAADVTDGVTLETTGIIDTEGKLDIVNNTGSEGITIAGAIVNESGNTTITNGDSTHTDIKSLKITDTGSIDNKNGTLDITNYGAETVSVTRKGVTENVNQGIQILGTVANNGSTNITNNNGAIRVPVEGTSTSSMQQGKITTKGGKLTINNTSGSGVTVEGEVKNEDNAVAITNGSSAATNDGGVKIVNREFDDSTVAKAIIQASANTGDAINITNYGKLGIGISGTLSNTGTGAIRIDNHSTDAQHGIVLTSDGVIENSNGDLYIINNAQEGGITLLGKIDVPMGDIIIKDNSGTTGGITVKAKEFTKDKGDIYISNKGENSEGDGIRILSQIYTGDGNIYIVNEDSDITFGKGLTSEHQDNDNGYLVTNNGNIVITLKNGSIINTLNDGTEGDYSNYDTASGITGNPYRTLIVAKGKDNGLGNLTLSVTDGDIGKISSSDKAGDINSNNIDYRDSINVNVEGAINLYVRNKNSTDNRVVNLRAKQSDLNIRNAFVQGDMILSAPDWRQADNDTSSTDYYKGYSVNMTGDGVLEGGAVTAKNLTVLASNTIGSAEHPFTYIQTKNSDNTQTAAFEAENNIYLKARVNPINVNQIVSKQGNLDLNFLQGGNIQHIATEAGNVNIKLGDTTVIDTIGSSNKLNIEQDKGDLTITNIGGDVVAIDFNDILYPHDNIKLDGVACIPQTIDIAVNGDDSTLLVYNTYVKGANNGQGAYDEYGNKLTDVKIAAENIIMAATNIPKSVVSTAKNPIGLDFRLDKEAVGIRAYGNGAPLSLEMTGSNNSIGGEAISSINSDNLNSRGVIFNKLYTSNAYVYTVDKDFTLNDANIANYGEFRNGFGSNYNHLYAIVDNDFRRLIFDRSNPASVQMYTGKTGNFAFRMDDTIKMHTNAPVVHYDPYTLVNGYSDENSFYNLAYKETHVQQNFVKHKQDMQTTIPRLDYSRVVTFDVLPDSDLISNFKIYQISRTGASIQSDETMKAKKVVPIRIKLDDENVDITVDAKVVRIENGVAEVKFMNMPEDIANKIMYRNFKANTKDNDLTMNTKDSTL